MSHLSQIKENKSVSEKDFRSPIKNEEEINNTRLYARAFYEYIFNGKVGAPVREKLRNGAKVLEFRSDGGIWAIEVSADYPNSEFYAVDSIIPKFDNKIDNVKFIECNIFEKLPFPANEFDYIFSESKFLYMEKNTFRKVLLEIFRVLKPEGISWIKKQNIDYDISTSFENYVKETEKAESIVYRIVETQIGSGDTEGEFLLEVIILFYKNVKDCLAPLMNISFEEFDDLINNFQSESNAEGSKVILKHKQVLARKKRMYC
ncbi:19502_t:CDS:2 [Cetraspora pellucida]|uniref:19502_t:CDS:1 n=1 Tax=Cetraspora pellucida TaxID=1433469 RepID=A0A9N8ZU40_9GLOM|nr:19502_t:CDS:2 [Cetraspora pellucida]